MTSFLRERLDQIGWVLHHLDDLESDFSVLHRVDDIYAMESADFFKKANRLFAYKGVIRFRVEAEAQEETDHSPNAHVGEVEKLVSPHDLLALYDQPGPQQ